MFVGSPLSVLYFAAQILAITTFFGPFTFPANATMGHSEKANEISL
jgi:hypothetical protein